jgi:ribonuclease P protein subunit RPR2
VRVLLVDDDAGLRSLVRATLEVSDVVLDEAESARQASAAVALHPPDAIVLDVGLPGEDGIGLCRRLKHDAATRHIPIVLLTGDVENATPGRVAGADAFLLKPFSPLELVGALERLTGQGRGIPSRRDGPADGDQLMLYARDMQHLLELERAQRALLQSAYRETVAALPSALETKDTATKAHSQRVQRYASELARYRAPELLADQSSEYGFLLHDVGKIGIPDHVLRKPRALTAAEQRLMRTHTVLGEQMLGGVALLQGEGLRVVRSHHERWDGTGYPDGLGGEEIPLGARVFAVADSLDAMTTKRPYRDALPWATARAEILAEAGSQFDPEVVEAFRGAERTLREIKRELVAA